MPDQPSDTSSTREPSLWQRYRRPILTAVGALLLVVLLRVVFPGVDFSRGSTARWWLIGAFVVVAIVVLGVQRVIRRRREADASGDAST